MGRLTIAFLGTGLMGRPMATRLADAGFPLHAWNRTTAKARTIAEHGALVCDSVEQAVRGAAIVVSMLEAGPAVGATIAAALPAMMPGTLWIDMSSTRHDEASSSSIQSCR